MDYREGKWAQQIISQQNSDGTWGRNFHSLSQPSNRYPLTTEQALRRLLALGFTANDAPIRKTLDCLTSCLMGERKIDDYWEKTHDWQLFTQLMLSAWIRVFEPENAVALSFAKRWANVIGASFAEGCFKHEAYLAAYQTEFAPNPKGAREIDPTALYHLLLLPGVLPREVEALYLDHVINKADGIYYVYSKLIAEPPGCFQTKQASWYCAALETLARYDLAREQLGFAIDWLKANQDSDTQWDFSSKASDGVYFPLSDSWRTAEDRRLDCTNRVRALLEDLGE